MEDVDDWISSKYAWMVVVQGMAYHRPRGQRPGAREAGGEAMRVNIYAEEMTDKVTVISKEIDGHVFTGLRFWLELPATVSGKQYCGPFMHRPGDDDSSAVTFWSKRDLRKQLRKALALLDAHYCGSSRPRKRRK